MNPSFRGGEGSAARRPFSRRPICYIVNEFEQVRRAGFLVNKFEQVWGQAWVGGGSHVSGRQGMKGYQVNRF